MTDDIDKAALADGLDAAGNKAEAKAVRADLHAEQLKSIGREDLAASLLESTPTDDNTDDSTAEQQPAEPKAEVTEAEADAALVASALQRDVGWPTAGSDSERDR